MNSLFIGHELIRLTVTESTNNYAAMLVSGANWSEGTVIVADHQTAGRGRHLRNWHSSPGKNLTFSILLKPSFLTVENSFLLSMVSALAVASTVQECLPDVEVKVKWPNDIYVGAEKIAGILIQPGIRGRSLTHAIVGIGLNVNEAEFPEHGATSIFLMSGSTSDKDEVLRKLLARFEALYLRSRANQQSIIDAYHQILMGYNEELTYMLGDQKVKAILRVVRPSGKAVFNIEGKEEEYDIDQIRLAR